MSNPDQIRAEIAATRADLSNTVNELGDKVSPSHIARRQTTRIRRSASSVKNRVMGVSNTATSKAGDALSSVGDSVSEAPGMITARTQGSPMAAGLIAFGSGMLLSFIVMLGIYGIPAVLGASANIHVLTTYIFQLTVWTPPLYNTAAADYWRSELSKIVEDRRPAVGVHSLSWRGASHMSILWLRLPLASNGVDVDMILGYDAVVGMQRESGGASGIRAA